MVLETRGSTRKRECFNGHRFYTLEVICLPEAKEKSEEQLALIAHALNVIKHYGGNVSAAARELNMRRYTLAALIKDHI
jgi:DNA-binding NtrC family response regulator